MEQGLKTLIIALLLGVCLAARAGADPTADDLCTSGDAKLDKGDLDGAMADYNHAIELDPKSATAYGDRGILKQDKGDDDGAIADYTRAIELDPTSSYAFMGRGQEKHYKGDLDGAIADYASALKADPQNAPAGAIYDSLAAAMQSKGDAEGAMADADRAVTLTPKDPAVYLFRGCEEFKLGKWKDALADFRKTTELPAESDMLVYQDYARLCIWFTRAQLGETDAATKELADYLAKRKADGVADDLFTREAGHLTGGVSEADLIAAASVSYKNPDPDQHCEVWFYAGVKKLAAGDKKAAVEDFKKSVATERRACAEYQIAQIELKALGE